MKDNGPVLIGTSDMIPHSVIESGVRSRRFGLIGSNLDFLNPTMHSQYVSTLLQARNPYDRQFIDLLKSDVSDLQFLKSLKVLIEFTEEVNYGGISDLVSRVLRHESGVEKFNFESEVLKSQLEILIQSLTEIESKSSKLNRSKRDSIIKLIQDFRNELRRFILETNKKF